MKKMIGLLVVVGAFGLGLVGCGDKGGGAGSASAGASAAPKSGGEAKSGGDAKAGGTYDDYVKAYCDCNKDLKCIADQTQKFQAVLSDPNAAMKATPETAKKLADCAPKM